MGRRQPENKEVRNNTLRQVLEGSSQHMLWEYMGYQFLAGYCQLLEKKWDNARGGIGDVGAKRISTAIVNPKVRILKITII